MNLRSNFTFNKLILLFLVLFFSLFVCFFHYRMGHFQSKDHVCLHLKSLVTLFSSHSNKVYTQSCRILHFLKNSQKLVVQIRQTNCQKSIKFCGKPVCWQCCQLICWRLCDKLRCGNSTDIVLRPPPAEQPTHIVHRVAKYTKFYSHFLCKKK